MTSKNVYSSDSIKTLVGLEAVRHRSTMYLGSKGLPGILHLVTEALDNSLDEHLLSTFTGDLPISVVYNVHGKSVSVMIKDHGRGIPVDKLLDVTSKLHTSGKFDQSAYEISGGLNGIGLKACVALSGYILIATTNGTDTGVIAYSKGEVLYHHTFYDTGGEHGTTVVFSPDSTHFHELDQFLSVGVPILRKRMKFHGVMSSCNLVFGSSKQLNAKKIVEHCPTTESEVLDYIQTLRDMKIKEEYKKDRQQDAKAYIREEFGATNAIVWELAIKRPLDKVGYDIRLYLADNCRVLKRGLACVMNNLNIDNPTSDHIRGINASVKTMLDRYIDNEEVRDYFNAVYKLPLYTFVKAQWPGAEFENQTKTGFNDPDFYIAYTTTLNRHLASIPEATWTELYYLLEEDINQKYRDHFSKSHGGGKKFTDIDMSLGADASMFFQCSTTDARLRELFIVEGMSAFGSAKMAADGYFQSVLAISGKPINGIQKDMDEFLKDRHIMNLITILGVTPKDTTLENLNFNRIIIMCDADSHGEHISALMIGNLYKLNPLLIEEGRVSIATPPLYTLNVNNKMMIYLKDYEALLETKVTQVYQKLLHLYVRIHGGDWIRVVGKHYYQLCYLVDQVGAIIKGASRAIGLELQLIEILLKHTSYSGEYVIDYEGVIKDTGADGVDVRSGVAYLSMDMTDVVIPLSRYFGLCEDGLFHNFHRYNTSNFDIGITTTMTDTYKETPILITHLMELFARMDGALGEATLLKGLGEMDTIDLRISSMAPETRATITVTGVGDSSKLLALLGVDSTYRKRLVLA